MAVQNEITTSIKVVSVENDRMMKVLAQGLTAKYPMPLRVPDGFRVPNIDDVLRCKLVWSRNQDGSPRMVGDKTHPSDKTWDYYWSVAPLGWNLPDEQTNDSGGTVYDEAGKRAAGQAMPSSQPDRFTLAEEVKRRSIERQQALTQAVAFISSGQWQVMVNADKSGQFPNDLGGIVLDMAERFYGFITGEASSIDVDAPLATSETDGAEPPLGEPDMEGIPW